LSKTPSRFPFLGPEEPFKVDGLVKSLKMRYSVIPVETGIRSFQYLGRFWIPACAGMTTFYEFLKINNFAINQQKNVNFAKLSRQGGTRELKRNTPGGLTTKIEPYPLPSRERVG
jgi:hypothetical protein